MFSSAPSSGVLTNDQRFELDKQIRAATEAYHRLWEMDQKVFVPAVLGVFVWWRSNLGLMETSVTVALGVYFLDFSFQERVIRAEKFRKELKQLAALYQSASAAGCGVTHEDVYLRALEVLAPFIASTADLLPKGFFDHIAAVSDNYFEILFKAPHQLPSAKIAEKAQAGTGYLQSALSIFSRKPPTTTLEEKVFQHARSGNVVTNSLSSMKLRLYGYSSIEQLNQATTGSGLAGVRNAVAHLIPKTM